MSDATIPAQFMRHANADKAPTKKAQLIGLLKRRHGVGLKAISEHLGWQPHTTRAAISGLRKQGLAVDRYQQSSGAMVYKIIAEPAEVSGEAAE